MNIYIIIPCYNEEQFIANTLTSLQNQTLKPKKIIVVNDNSTDKSLEIINAFAKADSTIQTITTAATPGHLPGSKIVQAFYQGLDNLDQEYDVICKFDADLIFPSNYLEVIVQVFKKNAKAGMVGGFCYIETNEGWVLENLTNKDHIRGALKAYRKECFAQIGGLKTAMGWDTVDELLAKYHGWDIITLPELTVRHLKPTGQTYTKRAKHKQGEAFYTMRYGVILTSIASLKLAFLKRKLGYFYTYLRGYFRAKRAKTPYLVSKEEGKFIRSYRWKGIATKMRKS